MTVPVVPYFDKWIIKETYNWHIDPEAPERVKKDYAKWEKEVGETIPTD